MFNFIKKNKWLMVITSAVILLPMAVGLCLWNKLPDQVPFHWGMSGEVDGYASKPMAVFFMPLFMLAIQWFCALVTGLDPKGREHSDKVMGLVLWIIPALNLFLHVMVWLAAFGRKVDMNAVMPLVMGVMYLVIGNYLPKCKHNYTVGIRVTWTLDDEENWNATHRLAGKWWVGGGLATMLCALLPAVWSFAVMMAVTLVMVIVPTVYSYRFYKKKKNQEEEQ